MASYTYILTLGYDITKSGPQPEKIILRQGESITFANGKSQYIATMLGVKMNRKIYQPGEIEVEIHFMEKKPEDNITTVVPSFKDITDLLLHREVSLTIKNDDVIKFKSSQEQPQYTIAQGYYVHELNPQLRHDESGIVMYVKMNIASMDKLMTLNKYSKAYVAKKLGSGILMQESLNFGYQESKDPLIKTNVTDLQFLKYENELVFHDPKTDKNMVARIPSEFIQPYLVQYNETFYDFMVRTSNRCGEFLFFEDGKLTLGLPDSGDPVTIDEFESVTVQSVTTGPLDIPLYARDSVKEGNGEPGHLNYSVIGKTGNFPEEAFPENVSYNSEVATDEYIFPLYKDKATDLVREMMYDGEEKAAIFKLMKTMKKMASSKKSGAKVLITTGIQMAAPEAVATGLTALKVNSINKKLDSAFFKPLKGNSEQCNDDKVVQFGTLSKEGWTSLNYYKDVRKHEEEQQKEIICINLGTVFMPLKLGQKIKVAGTDNTYVIIQIVQSSEEEWTHDYDTYENRPTDQKGGQRSMKVYAIPSYKDEKDKMCFIPPVQPVPVIRKAGPQTAFIAASNDPKYQGRVRITYPWQSKGGMEKARLEAAVGALELAKEQQKTFIEDSARLSEEYKLLQKELEEMEIYLKYPENRFEIEKKISSEIEELNKEIQPLEREIDDALEVIREQEEKVSQLPKDTDERTKAELVLEKDIMVEEKNQKIKECNEKIAEKKKKIARLKAHLEEMENASYGSKSPEQNTVVIQKSEQVSETGKKLETAESRRDSAKQNIEEKEAAVEKASDDHSKSIKSIASPWIRVATPVATDGGGFYYVPREGDEVLVNYDNDNVERPYVVGQLYSKNTLDPRERMERKNSLKKLGSMALVSPNGHHIAFRDPNDGKGFLGSVLPGVKAINNVTTNLGVSIPYMDTYLKPKVLKELAGGIHIGDRYGLYEINMTSDGRKIDIKSPLGQVNLSAFTGISITAPNGDIKIEGKNIDIKAGNKLTIESGTNIGLGTGIGSPQYQWTKSTWFKNLAFGFGHEVLLQAAPEAGKEAYKFLPVTDMTFIRYMTQVFLRPVDGTMLIKSHKYMLLEAGKGKALIKNQKYKNKKADDYFHVYKNMMECIDYLQFGLGDFSMKYKELWKIGHEARTKYEKLAKEYLKNEKDPDIMNTAFAFDTEKDWNPAVVSDLVTMEKLKDTAKDPKKQKELQDLAKALGVAVYTTHRLVNSYKKWVNAVEEKNWVVKIFKDTLHEYLDGRWESLYKRLDKEQLLNRFLLKKDPDELDVFVWEATPLKRRIAALFLININNSYQNSKNNYIYVGFDKKFMLDEKLSKDYYWKRAIKNIDRVIQNNFARTFLMQFADSYVNNMFTKDKWTACEIWDKGKGGQILMSDNEDYTLNLVKDGVKSSHMENQFNLNRLIEKLYNVK